MRVSQEMRTIQICQAILHKPKVQPFNQTGDKLLGAIADGPPSIFVVSNKGGCVVSLVGSPEHGSWLCG